jgi:hypothetical protein
MIHIPIHPTSTRLVECFNQLARLDWSHGLTRDEIRQFIPDFPLIIYLRLPAAKRFTSANAVLQCAIHAQTRADGGLNETKTARKRSLEEEILEYGGPPAWGSDPLFAGATQTGGSAMDVRQAHATIKE